jgi:hypothetical protein
VPSAISIGKTFKNFEDAIQLKKNLHEEKLM